MWSSNKEEKMKKHRFIKLISTMLASASLFTFAVNTKSTHNTVQAVSVKSLHKLNYSGKDIIKVSGNRPSFSKSTKSKAHGPWQKYSRLDYLNRTHTAELMGGGYVNYKEDYLNTITDLKRAIFNDITSMLFNTTELEHAKIMLTWNSQDFSTTRFGLSVSWLERNKYGFQEHADHFIAY